MFRSNQVCYKCLIPMINIWLLHCWPLLLGHRENCGSCLNLVSPPDFLSLRWMELSLSRKEKMAEYRYLFIRNIVCISICNRVACDSNKCVFGKKCIVYLILSRSLSNGNNSKAARTGQRARHWWGRKQKYIGKIIKIISRFLNICKFDHCVFGII